MQADDLRQRVLALVGQPQYRPAKPKAIARRLHLPEAELPVLKRVIKQLVSQGQLRFGAGHLVQPPGAARSSEVRGVFRRAAGGYGFVRPAGTKAARGREEDIYIPAHKSGDASDGDTVLVRLGRPRQRGPEQRARGEVVEVITRETRQFVGSYFESDGTGQVQVDGGVFTRPILVGDPGAKDARPGDKVVIEMVRFPSHLHDGEAVISEVLGRHGEPGVDTRLIMREFELPEAFPEEVLQAAREEAAAWDETQLPPGRVDLTGETVITIDPLDARDFDDAVSLARAANGHWRLGVHIADVSHFARAGSPLDQEARQRGTSVYLPDRVIPMLPEVISNNLASLQPDRVRYCVTAWVEFTADGAPVATDTCRSAIRSRRRFTYEEVDNYLADPAGWSEKIPPDVHALLGRMHELAMILRQRRRQHGALELSLPEVKLDLDENGAVRGARQIEHTVSHQIIEEFMLAANLAVAGLLRDRQVMFLRRIHERPDPRKLLVLTQFVRELGFAAESLESRFELQRVLGEVAGRPEEHAVNYAVLRSLQKAVYSPVEEGHFALAADCYCHFTSPIRRYPDLTVHRLVAELLADRKPAGDIGPLLVLAEHCSEREQRAEAAERELIKVKLLAYLSGKIGQQMDGVITGVEDFGLFVQGIELPAEGLIHVSSLADDYYQYEPSSHTLAGRRAGHQFRLGDLVRVEIAHVDVHRRELDFRLVQRLEHPPAAQRDGARNRPLPPHKSAAPAAGKARGGRKQKKSAPHGPPKGRGRQRGR